MFLDNVSPYSGDFALQSERTPGGYAHPFVYPPPSLVLLAPLAALDYGAATSAILLLSHVAFAGLVVGLWIIAASFGNIELTDRRRLLAAVALVAACVAMSQPSRVSLGHGQVNFIVCCGLIWFWVAYLQSAPKIVGAAGLIVATLLKPYFVIFAIFLFVLRGYRLIAPTAGLAIVLVAITVLVTPSQVWKDWAINFLFEIGDSTVYLRQYPIYSADNFSLRSAIHDLSAPLGLTTETVSQMGGGYRLQCWPCTSRRFFVFATQLQQPKRT